MIAFEARYVVVVAVLSIASAHVRASDGSPSTPDRTVQVAGNGLDRVDRAIVHSTVNTPTGVIRKTTETVDLYGDLKGTVLYLVTSNFDFVHGTLVNTGDSVYSGTIAGSAPVMIHDDQSRFEANLNTGQDSGQVYLFDHIAGAKVRCHLDAVGTGVNADGNPTFTYRGECTFRGQ